jgi:hypothetical protein
MPKPSAIFEYWDSPFRSSVRWTISAFFIFLSFKLLHFLSANFLSHYDSSRHLFLGIRRQVTPKRATPNRATPKRNGPSYDRQFARAFTSTCTHGTITANCIVRHRQVSLLPTRQHSSEISCRWRFVSARCDVNLLVKINLRIFCRSAECLFPVGVVS